VFVRAGDHLERFASGAPVANFPAAVVFEVRPIGAPFPPITLLDSIANEGPKALIHVENEKYQ